jgi:hypothetical protein
MLFEFFGFFFYSSYLSLESSSNIRLECLKIKYREERKKK